MRRRPERGIGWAEEQQAGYAGCGGKMAYAGVMAEKKTALGETAKELNEWQVSPGLALIPQNTLRLGFPADDEQSGRIFATQPIGHVCPPRYGPVFRARPAAWM